MEVREFVYHYTTARTAIDHILRTKTLRLGRLGGVNDPRESQHRDFTFYTRGAKSISEFDFGSFDEVCEDLAVNSYALCCGTGEVDERGRESGALRPHMWANYGGRHTGVCLVLDKEILHQSILDASSGAAVYAGNVNYFDLGEVSAASQSAYSLYLEDWLKDKEGYFDFHISNYSKGMFFVKHSDWRDESEYRWVVRMRNGSDIFVDISKALIKCVVGHEVSTPDFHYLREQCLTSGVPLHKVSWRGGGSLSKDLLIDDGLFQLNFDWSYSMTVPCTAIFSRATDGVGNPQIFALSSKNGSVVHYENAEGLDECLELMGYSKEEALVEVDTFGFSAGRLIEHDKPLRINVVDGEFYLWGDEEIPYYGAFISANGKAHKIR